MSITSLARIRTYSIQVICLLVAIVGIILYACSGGNDTVPVVEDSTPHTAIYVGGLFEGPEIYHSDCPSTCPGNFDVECTENCSNKDSCQQPQCPDGQAPHCYDQIFPRVRKFAHADRIGALGLTTVIHSFLHFYPDGSLVMNGTPLVYSDGTINLDVAYLKDIYKRVKASGKVTKILLSFGGWGTTDYTFSRILASKSVYPDRANNPFFKNLLIAKQYFQFDGLDLDFEPTGKFDVGYNKTYSDLIADITRWATANGITITYGPYDSGEITWWKDLLLKTVDDSGRQLVSWVNVQFYDGGGRNTYEAWFNGLTDPKNGISDMEHFIAVGYDWKTKPSNIQKALAAIKNGDASRGMPPHPRFNSAFLYQYTNLANCIPGTNGCAQDYSTALNNGLQGIVPTP